MLLFDYGEKGRCLTMGEKVVVLTVVEKVVVCL